jgi:hypothetical protein
MSSPPPTQASNSPFQGIEGIKDASKIEATDRLKAAILGKPKSGKSWFASTAPAPVLFYDFDDRAESLAGKEGVFIKTLVDTQLKPTVLAELEKDLSLFQYKKLKGESIPTSFVFDTVTNLLTYIKHAYLQSNPKDGRALRLGGNLVQIGMSYDWINVANRFLDYIITEYSALGNVILVFHEKDEKDQAESKPNDTRYTGLITVNPQFIAPILSKFNEVFRITVKATKTETLYTVDCKPTDEVLASTSLLLDATEPPNLMQMVAKHKQRKLFQLK